MGDTCKHRWFWYMAAADERGWKCVRCELRPGEPPGYSPQLDVENLIDKVEAILFQLNESEIVYVSNGAEGESIVNRVARRCRESATYDQVSIARFILEIEGDDQHAAYWRKEGEALRDGRDERRRCHCGALATCFTVGREDGATCGAHMKLFDEDGAP